MTRSIPLTILTILILVLSACSLVDAKRDQPIEMIAYSSLTEDEQSYVLVSPKDSTVELVDVDVQIRSIVGPGYEHDQVYAVTFHQRSRDVPSLGELVVYVDLDKVSVVGKGIRPAKPS